MSQNDWRAVSLIFHTLYVTPMVISLLGLLVLTPLCAMKPTWSSSLVDYACAFIPIFNVAMALFYLVMPIRACIIWSSSYPNLVKAIEEKLPQPSPIFSLVKERQHDPDFE